MDKIKSLPYHFWLIAFSTIGLIASFWQTAEKIHGLKNPEAPLSCNINPIVDCGAVLDHPLSSVMGVSNSMIGMIIFTTLLVVSLLLWGKVKLTSAAQKLLLGVVTILISFSVWFFLVSLYDIGKICIFCIFIWTSSVPLFTLTYAKYGSAILNKKQARFFKTYALRIIASVYLLGILLFLTNFRDYYFG